MFWQHSWTWQGGFTLCFLLRLPLRPNAEFQWVAAAAAAFAGCFVPCACFAYGCMVSMRNTEGITQHFLGYHEWLTVSCA